MSKQNNGGEPFDNEVDLALPEGSGNLTIEEHAQRLNIDAPVFAAVMQFEKWASGKRVPEAAFKQAVEGFLNAPMGGRK